MSWPTPYNSTSYWGRRYYPRGGLQNALLLIDGVPYLDQLKESTLTIGKNLNNRSTARFKLFQNNPDKVPLVGESVVIELGKCKGDPVKRVFAGSVERIKSTQEFCDAPIFWDVECVDHHRILDRRLVFNIFQRQPVDNLLNLINDQYLDGENITTVNVDTQNLFMEKAVFSYKKTSTTLNDISKNTGMAYYIDEFKDLHFFLRSKNKTDIQLTSVCAKTEDFCAFLKNEGCTGGIEFGKISVLITREKLRNEMFIIAGKDETQPRTEEKVGDDKNRTFSFAFPVSSPNKGFDGIILDTAVKVNGINQTVDEINGDPTAQWFFTKGENTLTQNDGETELGPSDTLTFNYIGLFDIIEKFRDGISVTNRASIERGTSGLYQDVEDDESIEDAGYAEQRAKGLIDRFKNPQVVISFISDEIIARPGDIIDVELPEYNIKSNQGTKGGGFLIEALTIRDVASKVWRYEYRCISTDHQGGWQDYYRTLEAFGRQLKLNEQQNLNVNVGNENEDEDTIGDQEGGGFSLEFEYSLGIGDLMAQPNDLSDCWLTGSAVIGRAGHCVTELKELGLI